MMYDFLRAMWILNKVTEEQITKYSPRFITQEERDEILNLPRN
jgi:hypothetical protein